MINLSISDVLFGESKYYCSMGQNTECRTGAVGCLEARKSVACRDGLSYPSEDKQTGLQVGPGLLK